MKERKSTRETKNMIQTALWLPREMHEQLKKEGGERGLGDEIRRRLQFSFEADPPNIGTDLLIGTINRIAIDLEEPWYGSKFAFDAFKAAIAVVLSYFESDVLKTEKPEASAKLRAIYGDENPESVGRILARIALRRSLSDRKANLDMGKKDT
jgi:hypothetical protein